MSQRKPVPVMGWVVVGSGGLQDFSDSPGSGSLSLLLSKSLSAWAEPTILFWITLDMSFRLQIELSGGQVDANVWISNRGQFQIILVAVCRIYFICNWKINNRSSNCWESGVSSSSVLDWVPLPRIPDHTESCDQNKNNEILPAVSDGVVKPLIYH